ncbi:CpsD/CapB family tyrosine-protein kinase [Streptococcus suis]|uniref:CpsD/CapB family tyrosine-protein kinase n=1 Tax=Streptococcus suis TaxID=1307 RepID=UPI00240E1231|nr:CpsD/CapB family tyrosine-protein kinase [Streptococcus suis]WFA75451.1 CpsD/CapB family tyrosine-protein kinase [Streptococcus suis]
MNRIELIDNGDSLASEAYRTLRSNILFSNYSNLQTILVTGSQPGEGKSTTSVNLAVSLAQMEKKVLLIDADMRKPTLHRYFAQRSRGGLSEVLSNQVRLNECLLQVPDSSLSVLLSGSIPPNPAEMLNSEAMTELFDALKEFYDFIIIDSPPVLAVTDAQILSTKVDACIMVTDTQLTKRKQLLEVKRRLANVNAPILGIVSNRMDNTTGDYY